MTHAQCTTQAHVSPESLHLVQLFLKQVALACRTARLCPWPCPAAFVRRPLRLPPLGSLVYMYFLSTSGCGARGHRDVAVTPGQVGRESQSTSVTKRVSVQSSPRDTLRVPLLCCSFSRAVTSSCPPFPLFVGLTRTLPSFLRLPKEGNPRPC